MKLQRFQFFLTLQVIPRNCFTIKDLDVGTKVRVEEELQVNFEFKIVCSKLALQFELVLLLYL